jgi:glyoxylase-like metal-dependent hydrolase (beta-lactamase superfamily II)
MLKGIRNGVIAYLAMAASLGAAAEEPVLSADLVKTGLYLITGGGGNSLLRLSASGSILVDGKQPGSYRALRSQIRRISKLSDLPVRVLVITDHHEHHTGSYAQFVAAGVAVLAQENSRRYLPAVTANPASGAKAPAPTVNFDHEYRLRMGGVEAQLLHVGSAHTDNDTVVHFPDLKVVAVGDLFTPDTPVPDFAGGGSLIGWGPALEQVLKLDFDIAVPSVGPPVTRAELAAFKAKIETLAARASALVKRGVPPEQLLAQLKTDDLGWHPTLSAEQLDHLYADLSPAR